MMLNFAYAASRRTADTEARMIWRGEKKLANSNVTLNYPSM
jgi:hypothetical protein